MLKKALAKAEKRIDEWETAEHQADLNLQQATRAPCLVDTPSGLFFVLGIDLS
jgi:hypothetical protein